MIIKELYGDKEFEQITLFLKDSSNNQYGDSSSSSYAESIPDSGEPEFTNPYGSVDNRPRKKKTETGNGIETSKPQEASTPFSSSLPPKSDRHQYKFPLTGIWEKVPTKSWEFFETSREVTTADGDKWPNMQEAASKWFNNVRRYISSGNSKPSPSAKDCVKDVETLGFTKPRSTPKEVGSDLEAAKSTHAAEGEGGDGGDEVLTEKETKTLLKKMMREFLDSMIETPPSPKRTHRVNKQVKEAAMAVLTKPTTQKGTGKSVKIECCFGALWWDKKTLRGLEKEKQSVRLNISGF